MSPKAVDSIDRRPRDAAGAAWHSRFFAGLFGLRYDGPKGPFAPVRVNDTLTLDFGDAAEPVPVEHYAFHVGDAEFDGKRGDEARLPARASDVLGRPGAWSFGPTLWSTSAMTRRMADIVG
jgi:hypothetical protein